MKQLQFSSNHAKEAFLLLETIVIKKMKTGLQWLDENKDKFNLCLIGGGALQYYITETREQSPDIDFVVDSFSSVKEIIKNDNLKSSIVNPGKGPIGITIIDMEIDLLDIKYQPFFKNIFSNYLYNEITIFGFQCKIIIPELLFLNKYHVAREKDDEDMFLLLKEPGTLDKQKVLDLTQEFVKQKIFTVGEYATIKSYLDYYLS